MITAGTYRDSTVVVFGLGRTGVTAALSLQGAGADVWAWDDSEAGRVSAAEKGVNVRDPHNADWSLVEALVLSPGVPHHLPKPHWTAVLAEQHDVPIICDIEILAREVNARPESERPTIIAITGTNGKSTTTALVGHVLKALGKDAQVGGNIGRGVLDLDRMHGGSHYVLELSSYQLERTFSLRANAAVLLNLSPDHLDRHGTMDDYSLAKQRIFANQTEDDAVVVGVDDDHGRALTTELKVRNGRRIIPVSSQRALGHGVFALGGKLMDRTSRRGRMVCDLREAQALEGDHNAQNAAAAYAAVASLGYDPTAIGKAILSFPGLAHRMETVATLRNVRFVNDSKATNADAARQALGSYERIYWIAGGQPKAGGLEPVADLFGRVAKAYLIGEAAEAFAQTLQEADVPHDVCGDLQRAVLLAARDALSSGDENAIVLLSPACSSFDQFADFEQRGEVFREAVNRLIGSCQGGRCEYSAA